MSDFHLSDCDLQEGGACSCGGLDPAVIARHGLVVSVVAAPRGLGLFVRHRGASCFIEAKQLPTDILAALAAAAHLPHAHDVMALGGPTDHVNLNKSRETVIAQLKALALSQGITGGLFPHFDLDAETGADEATTPLLESIGSEGASI